MGEVTAPDRRSWRVRRRWITRRLQLPRRDDLDATDGFFGLDAFDVDGVSSIVVGVVIALTVAFAFVLVWPLLALAIELIVLTMLVLGGIVARLLFRRPWQIVATTDGPPPEKRAWAVVGWRGSGAAIEEIETALRSGRDPRLGSAERAAAPVPTGD